MKTLIFSILSLMICLGAAAQNEQKTPLLSGKIIYKETQKLNIQLDGDGAQFADMLPKERTSYKSLIFNEDASLYENSKVEEEEGASHVEESDGMMVQIQMVEPENKIFVDFDKKLSVEQREFMTRSFLIEKELSYIDWKITGGQKEILGYQCTEAVCKNSKGEEIKAWFTPQIPVSAGPDTLYNLPGIIVELNIADGDKTLTAMSIEDISIDKSQLKKPKKGKKVTHEEFKEIVAEKMKEMGAESVEGVQTVVEIKHH
ncbi:GLPGLI family protein [Bacteroidota bacterium]